MKDKHFMELEVQETEYHKEELEKQQQIDHLNSLDYGIKNSLEDQIFKIKNHNK